MRPLARESRRVQAAILNADDFGLSQSANQAIIRAHVEGMLASASLMVNEPAAVDAVRLARGHPGLDVGLHLVLSCGASALGATALRAITGPDGRFPQSPAVAGIRAYFLAGARRQARQEVRAQFQRFAATGLPCTHCNGHQHLHLHPVVWDQALAGCEELGVPWIRIPHEEWVPHEGHGTMGQRLERTFFAVLRRRCLRTLRGRPMRTADRVYGHLATGRMDPDYVAALAARLRGRVNEIYLHPGTPHARPSPRVPGIDVELEALVSPKVREAFARNGVALVSFSRAGAAGREELPWRG